MAGVDDICFAEVRSGAVERFPFMDKAQTLNGWLESRLTDPAAHALYFETILQTPGIQQGDLLRAKAAGAGIESCPLAGYLDFISRLSSKAATFEDCTAACVERNRGVDTDADIGQACASGCGG